MDPKVPGKDSYSDDYEMDGLFAEVWFGLQVRTYFSDPFLHELHFLRLGYPKFYILPFTTS